MYNCWGFCVVLQLYKNSPSKAEKLRVENEKKAREEEKAKGGEGREERAGTGEDRKG